VMWELWAPNRYLDTFAMVVTPAGDVVAPATSLGDRVRLGRRDDPFSMAGGVANIQGVGGPDGALIVNILIP